MDARRRGSGTRGRLLVIGIIVAALFLGLIAIRFRQFLPRTPPRPTQPAAIDE